MVIRKRVMEQAMMVLEQASTSSAENILNILDFTVSWPSLVDHKGKSQIDSQQLVEIDLSAIYALRKVFAR